jgi:hypothetical protein
MGGSYGSSIATAWLWITHSWWTAGADSALAEAWCGEDSLVYLYDRAPALNWFIPRMFQSANREKRCTTEARWKQCCRIGKNIRIPVIYYKATRMPDRHHQCWLCPQQL